MGNDYDLRAIEEGRASDDSIRAANELLAFADAVVLNRHEEIDDARAAVIAALGEAALVDAAGVIAAYEHVDRVADASGIPIEDFKIEPTAEIRARFGLWE